MAAADYPLIAWNDGSAALAAAQYQPEAPNVIGLTAPGQINPTLPLLPADGDDAYTAGDAIIERLTTGRSVDRFRGEWVLQLPEHREDPITTFAVIFGAGNLEGVWCSISIGSHRQAYFTDTVDRRRSFAVNCGNSPVIDGEEILGHPLVDVRFEIVKVGAAEIVEIITQRQPLTLPIPPQSKATPSVSKRFETFPHTSVQGDYTGASYRQTTGNLTLDVDNLPRAWIEEKWEPFREHVSKGGVFAYIDREGQEPAYCFASGNVAAPEIRAGGYGKIMLTAGVAVI